MADKSDLAGWDEEDAYWTANYRNRPYASSGSQEYQPLPTGISVRLRRGLSQRGTHVGRRRVGSFPIVELLRAAGNVHMGTNEGCCARCLGSGHRQVLLRPKAIARVLL